MWEAGVSLVFKMIKNKIWAEMLFTIALATLIWCGVICCIDFIAENLVPLFASAIFAQVFKMSAVIISLASLITIFGVHDRLLKILPLKRGYKFCYVIFPNLSALFCALVIMMSAGFINPRVGEIDLRIIFGTVAILSAIVYTIALTIYHQTHLICKYKDVPTFANIMGTYNDGSVYVSYPIEDRTIEDLVEYGVFVLRNSKTAKLCGNTGAWYNISKGNYDKWQSIAANEKTEVKKPSDAEMNNIVN